MNNYDFLQRQHPVLKLVFVFVNLLFTGFVDSITLLYTLALILGLLCSKQKYILSWLRAIARLSPLFISILISGYLFSLPFPGQLELCLRISFLLSVSLFAFLTIPLEFLATMVNKNPHGFSHDVSRFLWKTSQLVPFFFKSFKEQYHQHKPDFVKAIVSSFASAHQADEKEIVIPVSNIAIPPIYIWSNIFLLFLIMAEIGFIIRSFI